MSAETSLEALLRADPDGGAILPGIDTRATPGVKDRDAAEDEMSSLAERLDELQERLWV